MTKPSPALYAVPLLLAAAVALPCSSASAREGGIAVDGCSGCHNGGKETNVSITSSTAMLTPGQTVRLTVSIDAVNGNKGGLYFRTSPVVGKVTLVSGESTKLNGANNGVMHATPKTASGGKVTFAIDYTAPSTPGDVELRAFGLSANGDGRSSGDGAGAGYLSLTFGCTGTTYYQDNDGDGHGSTESPPRIACSKPELYATNNDDCQDSIETVYPGATETCNGMDDDCDGMIDENLTITTYCEDKDGDGHGVRGGKTTTGCGPLIGYGLCDDDCDDADKSVFPTATEQCNYKDDNCNSRVDENARMTCGEGWCRRSSEGCMASLCVPGAPRAEECNALDDDCDGVVDNGDTLCVKGQVCFEGACKSAAEVGPLDAGGSITPRRDGGAVPASDGGVARPSEEPGMDMGSDGGCALAGSRAHEGAGDALLALLTVLLTARCSRSPGRPRPARARRARSPSSRSGT